MGRPKGSTRKGVLQAKQQEMAADALQQQVDSSEADDISVSVPAEVEVIAVELDEVRTMLDIRQEDGTVAVAYHPEQKEAEGEGETQTETNAEKVAETTTDAVSGGGGGGGSSPTQAEMDKFIGDVAHEYFMLGFKQGVAYGAGISGACFVLAQVLGYVLGTK